MPVKETLLVEGATPQDLMRARLILEPQVAAEAAQHADKSDVIKLGSIRISYALPDGIEQKVNAGGAHGPSRLSGLAV
jgi:DNA-binding FadR family transcriptional regulator